jgi:hypothetical protein
LPLGWSLVLELVIRIAVGESFQQDLEVALGAVAQLDEDLATDYTLYLLAVASPADEDRDGRGTGTALATMNPWPPCASD